MIHTGFMRYDLDLIWIDRKGRVIRKDFRVRPWRIQRCKNAWGVIEKPSGQALVETALIIPLLLLFVFGFLQLSVAVTAKQKLHYVTHYAAQVGGITNDDLRVLGAIGEFYEEDEIAVNIQSFSMQNQQEILSSERRTSDRVQVQISHPAPLNILLLGLSDFDLVSQASSIIYCQENAPPFTCS